jgi:hypothetical protein
MRSHVLFYEERHVTAVNATRGQSERRGRATKQRSAVEKDTRTVAVQPFARHIILWPTDDGKAERHGGWRLPHRSRRELVELALWWLVVAVGLTAGAVYIVKAATAR